MGRMIKYIFYTIGGLLALAIVASILLTLLFDPNDYRENIAAGVAEATGRELVIDGDIKLSLFPWLAVEIGSSRLANAEGFGDKPFASFERVRLSVRLLPLLLRREIVVGAAEISGLAVNLEVNERGENNWDDLAQPGETETTDETTAGASTSVIDIAGIDLNDAAFSYVDQQLGEEYALTQLNVTTGPVRTVADNAASISISDFEFSGTVLGLSDNETMLSLSVPDILLQIGAETVDVGSVELSIFGVIIRANIDEFSYAGSPSPSGTISIEEFSPRELMQALDIDVPATADPKVLSKLRIDATLAVANKQIRLSDLVMIFDDTTLRGELDLPRDAEGVLRLNLAVDRIDLNRYMAPADESAADVDAAAEAPVEIPADMIRALNARGDLTLEQAIVGPMQFDNLVVTFTAGNGLLRVHPISAEFFDGTYSGDLRINATSSVPVLSLNEQISNVDLAPLGRALFDVDKLTGTISGSFRVSGRGNDSAQILNTLSGDMSFTLNDGSFEGVDVWYEMRKARAFLKQEAPPEPTLPARTPFSEVRATGKVTNGVLRNDDFFAELPFMQLNGHGSVNIPAASLDYSLSARVFNRPEYMQDVTADELDDLTKAAIPLRITGDLASPKIGIDFEELLEDRVREEIEKKILDKLGDLFRR